LRRCGICPDPGRSGKPAEPQDADLGPAALAIVAGAVSLERRVAAMLPRWLLVSGDASYSIYLTHGFVVPVIGLAFVYLRWSSLAAEAVAVRPACLRARSWDGCLFAH
jgi:peptidoglycan/LPS O-acetylase OafA/YrhL